MRVRSFARFNLAAGLLAASTTIHATTLISDYVMARSVDINYDRNYGFGGELSTTGAGQFSITDSAYSQAVLNTAFGAMSGAASGAPRIPSPGSPTNATQASAWAEGQFQDSFHLSSATLTDGTPVTLLLTVTLDGTVERSAANTGLPYLPKVYAGWGFGRDYPLAAWQLSSSGSFVSTAQWTTVVGASFDLVGLLQVRTDGLDALQQLQSQQTQSGSGSAQYYLDSLTPGVTVTSDSGWNYASQVPAPAPASLMAAGLALLGGLSRRRASRSR
jgi:hypothetical protein